MSRRRRRGARVRDGDNLTLFLRPRRTRPRWRDFSDFFDPKASRPWYPHSYFPFPKEDNGINNENFLSIFGRYRTKDTIIPESMRGEDFDGHRLIGTSKLGEFYSLVTSGPGLGNHNNLFIQTVGGTMPSGRSQDRTQTWDSLNPGPPYRTGKPFFSVRSQLSSSQTFGGGYYTKAERVFGSQKLVDTYHGKFLDNGNWGSESLLGYQTGKPTSKALTSYSTLAWDSLKPRVEKANLGQFIYELKDLPGQLKTSATAFHNSWNAFGGGGSSKLMAPKSVADNFINHEFGWVPFISDIQKLIHLYQNSRDYMIRAVRDNDRWVRKEKILHEEEETKLVQKIYGAACLPGSGNFRLDNLCTSRTIDGFPCTGYTEIWTRDFSQVWGSGSFKYYRPEFDDKLIGFESQLTNIQRLLTLYGVRINPTLLWKITPWTWLLDWFTHIGDFIVHWDETINDSIVSKYLYIMERRTHTANKNVSIFFDSGPVSMSWVRSLQTKRRESADSPYGFNRSHDSLSSEQWAILGAIGLSRNL